ncbi:MAG: Polysaccharide export protein [Pedosphaera sp.]|nr:Polysaccharide export protein [Pedosphaera sp.]
MSDDVELSISELRKKRAQASAKPIDVAEEETEAGTYIETQPVRSTALMESPRGGGRGGDGDFDTDEKMDLPFDPWRLPGALTKRWYWLVLAGLIMGLLGGAVGYWRTQYKVRLTLNLRDVNNTGLDLSKDSDSYKPRHLENQTLINFLTSPQLIRAVSVSFNPPIPERKITSSILVAPERNSETIAVTLSGKDPQALVDLANLYATNAVEQSRMEQRSEPALSSIRFSNQLIDAQMQLTNYHRQLAEFRKDANLIDPEVQDPVYIKQLVDVLSKLDELKAHTNIAVRRSELLRDDPIRKSLKEAEDKLAVLRSEGKRDSHPSVVPVLERIDQLKKQLSTGSGSKNEGGNQITSRTAEENLQYKQLELEIAELEQRKEELQQKVSSINKHAPYYAQIKFGIKSAESWQAKLKNLQSQAQQYLAGAQGYYDFSPVMLKDVDQSTRYRKGIIYAIGASIFGVIASMMLILLVEVIDPRLKTAADVRRVTNLPVLATLGNLNKMDERARKAWAFRTWTILSGTLSQSSNRGTVCGLISCAEGEGRTTWVEMLVDAARERGFEVTKLEFGKAFEEMKSRQNSESAKAEAETKSADKKEASNSSPESKPAPNSAANAENSSLVDLSTQNTNQSLTQAKAASVIHVQLPGLVWNLARRIQFQEELVKWRAVSQAVILIDLPPASMPEAILLAENLPQVLWLVDSGKSHARETRMHLETLRHARCKLVGAVLNHEPEPLIKL